MCRCLHHSKEAQKIRALQLAYRRKEAETSRDSAPNAGEIRSLGLLKDRKAEDVGVEKGKVLPTLQDNMPRGDGGKPVVH